MTDRTVGVDVSGGQIQGIVGAGSVVIENLVFNARPAEDPGQADAPIGPCAEAKAGFRSLNDAWADTTTAHGRLMLTVLGGLAEFERELIRQRTGEGRVRARARGYDLGVGRS